jgi:hypothetical protein
MKRIIKVVDSRNYYTDAIMQYDDGSQMPVTMTAEEYAIQDAKEHIADMAQAMIDGKHLFSVDEIMKHVETVEEKARDIGRQDEADRNNPDL